MTHFDPNLSLRSSKWIDLSLGRGETAPSSKAEVSPNGLGVVVFFSTNELVRLAQFVSRSKAYRCGTQYVFFTAKAEPKKLRETLETRVKGIRESGYYREFWFFFLRKRNTDAARIAVAVPRPRPEAMPCGVSPSPTPHTIDCLSYACEFRIQICDTGARALVTIYRESF